MKKSMVIAAIVIGFASCTDSKTSDNNRLEDTNSVTNQDTLLEDNVLKNDTLDSKSQVLDSVKVVH